MLELNKICFTKDNKRILNNVDFTINEGEFVAITGPNGSGKSTLAQIIMGIKKQDAGSVIFEGKDISNFGIDERARAGIGFAFQQPVKFKGITVKELIRLSANKKIEKNEICDALSAVGLCANEYMNRELNSSLSGGELKRIEIASAIARQAKLLILDEPEAGIDLWSFNNLINLFSDIRTRLKGAIVIISHQEKILKTADRIVLLNSGEIQSNDGKEAVLSERFVMPDKCCKN